MLFWFIAMKIRGPIEVSKESAGFYRGLSESLVIRKKLKEKTKKQRKVSMAYSHQTPGGQVTGVEGAEAVGAELGWVVIASSHHAPSSHSALEGLI